MATYQSVQSATVDNSGTLVITKPASLAVGDLMLAGVWADRDGGSSASITTPSGWTVQESVNPGGTGNALLGVYTKIADSGDVAASNFTFEGTGSTGQMHLIGHILRFTDFGGIAGEASGSTGSTITSYSFSGFTPNPERTNTTYVIFSAQSDAGSPATTTTYAIATSNPTWTERAEGTVNGSTRGSSLGVATATRDEVTATGNVTLTFSRELASPRTAGVILALVPIVNGSTTVVTGETFIVNHPFLRNGVTEINGEDPDVNSMSSPQWSNPAKPTSTWDNTPKL